MEVHHHAHTARKKWYHFLWEFVMLFLAVFCGFLAENQREKVVERHREKEYILSMIEDLQTDTTNLGLTISGFSEIEQRFDSTISGFNEGVKTYSNQWAQLFIASYMQGYPDFYQSDRTIQQLKNAGGMRLLRNKTAVLGIIDYDTEIKDLALEVEALSKAQDRYREDVVQAWSMDKMFADAGQRSWSRTRSIVVHNNYWITNDPHTFEKIFNRLSEYNETVIRMNKNYSAAKEKALKLIELLKREYHIKGE